MAVEEFLTEEECYLLAILTDKSGLDQAEFLFTDDSDESTDGCFRAYPYQWSWWRDQAPLQIDQCARSIGKSLSIKLRAFAFPFCFPGQEMLITAPEQIHIKPLINLIEDMFLSVRLGREMIANRGGKIAIRQWPFWISFVNGANIQGRIPQLSGRGLKGSHPVVLEQDECFPAGTLVLAKRGLVPIEEINLTDEVLTHKRRWRKVTAVATRERETVVLRGHGWPEFKTSVHHPFWAIQGLEQNVYEKVEDHLRPVKALTQPGWIPAESMEGSYWSSPTVFPQVKHIPKFRKPGTNGIIPCEQDNEDFFWLCGLYLAEGSVTIDYRHVVFSVHVEEVEHVRSVLTNLGMKNHVSYNCEGAAGNVGVSSTALAKWMSKHFGRGAKNKEIPPWVLGLKRTYRQALLDGLIYGDGFYDKDSRYAEGRWKLSTCSKKLAISSRLLANSLEYTVSCGWTPPGTVILREKTYPTLGWYQVVGAVKGQGFVFDNLRYTKVREVVPTHQVETLYDLTVEEDHSFIAEGFCVSNSQDYPEAGWTEIIETLKRGTKGAIWRAHGVTRGIEDRFKKYTDRSDPNNKWKVHWITAQARPNWTDEERDEKIEMYGGSRESPDYRRNVLGVHGDKSSALFVLHRLARCTDSVEDSKYNKEEYQKFSISTEELEDLAGGTNQEDLELAMLRFLDFNASHLQYNTFWCGLDYGVTVDPTEILIAAEYTPSAAEIKQNKEAKLAVPEANKTRLKILSRIHLERISNPLQTVAVERIIQFYQPKTFAMDKAGNGIGLFQDLQARSTALAKVVRGYSFGEKVVVEIDGTVVLGEDEDPLKEAAIRSNVKEFSSDKAREYVDQGRVLLPWDKEIIASFQGVTFSFSNSIVDRTSLDPYGRRRRIFSQGNDHIIDAFRQLVMGHAQYKIEAFIEMQKQVLHEPVFDYFVTL